MAIPPQFLDELKNRLPAPEVVGRKVRLIRKGREHQGLCPFHKEKTPSFYVYDDHYHCFGCGVHGSIIDFVMGTEGLEFREAVEQLASQAGMQVPQDSPEERERAERRAGLQEVAEAACAYFEKMLRMPEGAQALDYLRGRGLTEATIRKFRLGYAPETRGALKAALARDGITEDLLVEAGLVKRNEDGRPPYDYFRGRVIFPITDRRGRVVAFGGRIMGAGEPKYLNSPETSLFQKGRLLYGLAQAIKPARDGGQLVAVEGYMDVIALAQAGIDYAVAPLGTALTEDQIAELWRLANNPVLCFDGDKAGQRAALRAAERALPLLKPGFGLRFAVLPGSEDPDSLVKNQGVEAMLALLQSAEPLSAMLWRVETAGRSTTSPEDRAALEDALKKQIFRIEDKTVQAHFLRDIKDRMWSLGRPQGQFQGRPGGGRSGAKGTWKGRGKDDFADQPVAPRPEVGQGRAKTVRRFEEILLATLINHPSLFDEVDERLGKLTISVVDLDNLRQEILKTLGGDPGLDSGTLQSHLTDCGYSGTLSKLLSPSVYGHAFFARPTTDLQTVREGWEEVYSLYLAPDLRAEVQAARQALADDASEEAYRRFMALKGQERSLTEDDDGTGAADDQ